MDNNLIDRIKYLLSHAFSKHGEGSYGLSSFIRKPNRLEIITAFLIFATFLGCLFLWAHMNEDQTLDNRKNRIPSIYASVSVSDKILKVSELKKDTSIHHADQKDMTIDEDPKKQENTQNVTKEKTEQTKQIEPSSTTDNAKIQSNLNKTKQDIKPPKTDLPEQDTSIATLTKEPKTVENVVSEVQKTPKVQAPQPVVNDPSDTNLSAIPDEPIWKKMSKKFEAHPRKGRIAIILRDIGFQANNLEVLLASIPKTTTLAINPYSETSAMDARLIRRDGFEFLMMLPMEPVEYPIKDPGAKGLLTTISKNANLERLNWILEKSNGYYGLINNMGGAFLRAPKQLEPIFETLKKRELVFVNSLGLDKNIGQNLAQEEGIPYISVDLTVDNILIEEDINRQLRSLELLAEEYGYAIGVINTYPLSIKNYVEWAEHINRTPTLQLVPLSNILIKKPK